MTQIVRLARIKPPQWLIKWLVNRAMQRPLSTLTGRDGSTYMERNRLLSWNNWTGIGARIHITHRSDEDPHRHDHPWPNISYILCNGYAEETPDGVFMRKPGDIIYRALSARHRLTLYKDQNGNTLPSISVFITFRKRQSWGFFVDGEKVPWWKYLKSRDGRDTLEDSKQDTTTVR